MPDIKRVLVPTDFSPASDIAFRYAVDLAQRHGASIHLLHVVEESSLAAAYPDGFYVEPPGLRAQAIDEAIGRLKEMLAIAIAVRITTTTEVQVGRAAATIADVAGTRGIDLIVMATHGRSGIAHLVMGSVAEHVVRIAPCAVLTVRDHSRIADAIALSAAEAAPPQLA
jgi:nucleotide-binding universal stress UspA family protein